MLSLQTLSWTWFPVPNAGCTSGQSAETCPSLSEERTDSLAPGPKSARMWSKLPLKLQSHYITHPVAIGDTLHAVPSMPTPCRDRHCWCHGRGSLPTLVFPSVQRVASINITLSHYWAGGRQWPGGVGLPRKPPRPLHRNRV